MTHVSFTVGIFNDNVPEGDEKFSLSMIRGTLEPSQRTAFGNPDHVTVTIYDDDDGK